jgi:hypothetical protein
MVSLNWRRLPAALAIAAGLLLLGGVSAGATTHTMPTIPGVDCKNPPQPATPSSGAAAAIDPGPVAPPTGDPFAPGSKISVYDVYGYAGLETVSYDPGCTDLVDGTNDFANFVTGITTLGVAVTVRLTRIVFNPTTMAVLTPMQEMATRAVGGSVFLPLIGAAGGLTGLWILWRSRRGDVRGAAGAAGWSAFVTAIALAVVIYPFTLGATVDKALTGAVGSVNQAISGNQGRTPADSVAANLHFALLYQTWLSENFGRANKGTAATYGPKLFAASAFTRAEQAQLRANPDKAEAMISAKQDAFRKAAEQLKGADPQAYARLSGKRNGDRVGYAFLALLGLLCAATYLILAMVRLLYAMILVRVGIAAVPLVAVIAQHPRFQRLLLSMFDTMGSALVSALAYGVVSAVIIAGGLGGLLSPTSTVDPVLTFVILAVLTYGAWLLTRKLVPGGVRLRESLRRIRENRPNAKSGDARYLEERVPGVSDVFDDRPSEAGAYSHAIPAEVHQRPKVFGSAARGALQGAGATVAAGVVTGGTVTAGAAAVGAAKGAATAAGVTAASRATGSALAGDAAGRTIAARLDGAQPPARAGLGQQASASRAVGTSVGASVRASAGGVIGGSSPERGAIAGGRPAVDPVEIYEPGRHVREVTVAPVTREQRKDVYQIYAPAERVGV